MTLVAGSLEALSTVLAVGTHLQLPAGSDVVVVATAAAFSGMTEAAVAAAAVLEPFDVRVEALMSADRTSAGEPYFAQRVAQADLVVLCDGSALHARSVWRDTALGEAIRTCSRLVAVGAVASVLGEVMIDPRGGAPMMGLGFRRGLVLAVPASDEQLRRTRSLLASDVTLAVIGPMGAVAWDGEVWRVERDDVVVTRGGDSVSL